MSRGHGAVQQRVLDVLRDQASEHGEDFLPVTNLAQRVFASDAPTRAQVESTRRAVKTLADDGLVSLSMVDVPQRVPYRNVPYPVSRSAQMLAVRHFLHRRLATGASRAEDQL